MSLPPLRWPSHTFSVLIEPPTEEPITLQEAKLRAGLDWADGDPRDQLMKDFIAAARSKVEQDTGLALLPQTRDLFYDGSKLTDPLLVGVGQCRPLLEVISVNPIEPGPAIEWPTLPVGVAVVIRLKAGWVDVATLRKHAPLLVQAVGLLTAHYATLGRDLASLDSLEDVPQGYPELIQPYVPMVTP